MADVKIMFWNPSLLLNQYFGGCFRIWQMLQGNRFCGDSGNRGKAKIKTGPQLQKTKNCHYITKPLVYIRQRFCTRQRISSTAPAFPPNPADEMVNCPRRTSCLDLKMPADAESRSSLRKLTSLWKIFAPAPAWTYLVIRMGRLKSPEVCSSGNFWPSILCSWL